MNEWEKTAIRNGTRATGRTCFATTTRANEVGGRGGEGRENVERKGAGVRGVGWGAMAVCLCKHRQHQAQAKRMRLSEQAAPAGPTAGDGPILSIWG